VIPFGPEIQYVGEKPGGPITLYVYEGASGEFTLYENEGVNYHYEDGAFPTIRFSNDDPLRTLVIAEREGSYTGMVEEREFNIVYMEKAHPRPFDLSARADHSGKYSGDE
jgi:alpha-D-xyloside xylohydrolase